MPQPAIWYGIRKRGGWYLASDAWVGRQLIDVRWVRLDNPRALYRSSKREAEAIAEDHPGSAVTRIQVVDIGPE